MQINKSVTCKKIEELFRLVGKLKKKANVKALSFSGSYSKENKTESFSVNWTEEEEV